MLQGTGTNKHMVEKKSESEWIVYGTDARWGLPIGEWASEELALAYARSGKAGDMGEGVYVVEALPLGTRLEEGQ